MERRRAQRQPWLYRFFIVGFGLLLTLLLIWFLAFVLSDIGGLPGPKYEDIEKQYVDQTVRDQLAALEKEVATLQTQMDNQREIQGILSQSTQNSRQTMDQLVAIHKLNLEKSVKPTDTEQQSLAESEAQFLDNQKRFQQANEEIARLSEQQRAAKEKIAALNEKVKVNRKPAEEEFRKAREYHQLKVAALKLAVIVPLLLLAAWFALKQRGSAYAPIIYASFCATFWTTGVVMFQHFPREYFKYIATGAAIAIVLAFLVHLIRSISAPKADWLLKQRREAYNGNRCPVCAFPIRRGISKELYWGRRGPRGLLPVLQATEPEVEKPYTCPACGEALFIPCTGCGKTRHAFLPYCEHCGAGSETANKGAPETA